MTKLAEERREGTRRRNMKNNNNNIKEERGRQMKSRASTGLRYAAVNPSRVAENSNRLGKAMRVRQPTTRSGLRTFFGSSAPDLAPLDLFSSLSHLVRSFPSVISPHFRPQSTHSQPPPAHWFSTRRRQLAILSSVPSRSCLKTLRLGGSLN